MKALLSVTITILLGLVAVQAEGPCDVGDDREDFASRARSISESNDSDETIFAPRGAILALESARIQLHLKFALCDAACWHDGPGYQRDDKTSAAPRAPPGINS